jgi:hypothetical protein
MNPTLTRWRRRAGTVTVLCLLLAAPAGWSGSPATAAVRPDASSSASPSGGGNSLESAANKAGQTGRRVAMSLLGLGLAIAAIVLAFKRDFREAAAVFAVGIVAVLLATPAGLNLLRDTVGSVFGGR